MIIFEKSLQLSINNNKPCIHKFLIKVCDQIKKPLLDVLFMSDKRKKVLLLLQDGPKGMDYLLKSLDTTRPALLPQMRVLEDSNLIIHYNDSYELTTIGKILVEEIVPLLNTLEVFDVDIDYWGNHKLMFAPRSLLSRLREIKGCKVIEPNLVNIYEANKDFIETCATSKDLFFILTFAHPVFTTLSSQFIANGSNIEIIINADLLQKFKANWQKEVQGYIDSEKVKFYLYPNDIELGTFAQNEHCFVLRMLSNNKTYDYSQLFCNGPDALKWGRELFDFYLKDSIPITEI